MGFQFSAPEAGLYGQTHLLAQIFIIMFSFISWKGNDGVTPGILIKFGTYPWIRHTGRAAQSNRSKLAKTWPDRLWKKIQKKVKYD